MYTGPDIVQDGLIFAIDAGSERSYPGTGTAVTGLVGSNTGTLTNGVTFSTDNGGTWGFDGIDDLIYLNSGTALVLNDFTITQWIQFPATSSRMSIGGGSYTGGNSYRGYIWYRSAQNEIRVTMDGETGAIFTVSESVYCDKWSQITATRSGGYL